MKKKYHIGDILSITTGKLVSPRHIDGVYDILNFMTGDNLFTHQLGRGSDECRPWLKAQHPQLKSIDTSNINPDNWQDWLLKMVDQYGEYLDVEPLPEGVHDSIDPLTELSRMVPEKKVVVIEGETK